MNRAKSEAKRCACLLVLFALSLCMTSSLIAQDDDQGFRLHLLPDHVVATMESRDRWIASLPDNESLAPQFLIENLLRWLPGQTVRVAFLGGDTNLHKDIEEATKQITDACNLKLDFGFNPTTNAYRRWSTSDKSYQAEIRVSFDQGGFFSLVGADSTSPIIGDPNSPVGGRPHQRSLNLGGFQIQRPASWKRTTRHEFLHALAFHHEHQIPGGGGCDEQFRWENDPGYLRTTDRDVFITDTNGKRPGIYTYLSGAPNFWSRAKVDHNLRQMSLRPGISFDLLDRRSIMLYRFPDLFYRTIPSPCSPLGDGEDLSHGDKEGLRRLYPHQAPLVNTIMDSQETTVEAIMGNESYAKQFEGVIQSKRAVLDKR